ncbi:M23 family metallopeptidase [Curtobacterium sp. MCPF17_052]|uniref:M23 family metallopeptidase n=1 Tax=Curtobacterium sp. MCPF17_052 TaxID=2175655 RepID=UPI0024DF4DB8|nr:M23 family metallopeptidase [Curtobacterium sp. MCPF17_052]WIB11459.1 M23 family metallopeptidase [Curtobacterium sp. MCPF17_052]
MLAAGALVALVPSGAASAATYPSWDDVQAAKQSQSDQAAKVTEIRGLIAQLQSQSAAKEKAAAAAGTAYQDAQTDYDRKALEQRKLQSQADDAEKTAAASEAQAGQLAAQLGRSSSQDVTTDLLTKPSASGDLLYELGAMSKLTEQADGIYSEASQDRGTAQALADKSKVAEDALGELAAQAQVKMRAAQSAADQAQAAVAAQAANQDRLEAQLALLTSKTKTTQAGYEKGVKIEKERQARLARERAAAAAAAARALPAAATAGVPASGGGASGGGAANSSGWVRPAAGFQSSPYGLRVDPYTHVYTLHAGVDLAPACYSPIYAAASGTVTFAGNGGGYGNEVILDNGGGISTAYGHIVNGGIMVAAGQHVTAGQQIAQVGSTGWSTGCHLHFETRVNGAAVDPVPFMAARGDLGMSTSTARRH